MQLTGLTFKAIPLFAIILVGCETTHPQESLTVSPSFSQGNKKMEPYVAQAFLLLKEGKYSEASSSINQSLQSYPKSVVLHLLNALTYEKLAESGDATGLELAIVGYQKAVCLDPFNSFALIQLGKIRYKEQQFDEAQEHFANALLLKPNDPDLIHEFAAASYYAYDIKTALVSVQKAMQFNPDDPLIHRSAAMIYAAIGDFHNAEKHFKLFQTKVGQDPEVEHLTNRFNDWQSLYKSGRLKLAAATNPLSSTPTDNTNLTSSGTSNAPSNAPNTTAASSSTTGNPPSSGPAAPASSATSSASGTSDSVSTEGGAGDSETESDENLTVDIPPAASGDVPTAEEFKEGEISQNVVGAPVTPGIMPAAPPGAPAGPGAPPPLSRAKIEVEPQIIMDCYILQITEDASSQKGNNILTNLAVTLNPGTYSVYNNSMWGHAAQPLPPNAPTGDTVTVTPDSAYNTGIFTAAGTSINTFTASRETFNLNNEGSISGQVFAAGVTWAGLTYSLNIANSGDARTEIVSRPTLMSFLKKESRFFSGTELVNVSGGNYGSNLSRYQVGTTVSVIPESVIGEIITLTIGIEASILQNPNPNLLSTIDVGKTRVETTARVRLGDTIMLGGIYERDQVDFSSGFPGLKDLPIIQYFFARSTTVSSRRSIMVLITPRSPDAVKSAVNRAMTRESVRPHLAELVSRNPDWFTPTANAVNIFNYINLDPILYYEFRTGDILPPSWKDEPALEDKLTELASFLYF